MFGDIGLDELLLKDVTWELLSKGTRRRLRVCDSPDLREATGAWGASPETVRGVSQLRVERVDCITYWRKALWYQTLIQEIAEAARISELELFS